MSKDLLDELLAEPEPSAGSWEVENAVLAPLLPEIDSIHDPGVRLFVRAMLLRAPHFWTIPSSFSGKHHPPDEHTIGGNVIHTQRVVRIVKIMCDSQERLPMERDVLLAAALLHDLTKGILIGDEMQYDIMHPYTVDRWVAKILSEDEQEPTADRSLAIMIDEDLLGQILRIVRCHLGPWSPIPETVPLTSLEWTLHLADNIASRMHWVIDGDEVDVGRWIRASDS